MSQGLRPVRIRISKENDVYTVMMTTDKLANELGFDLAMAMKMKTVVSELAHNILKYAGAGFIQIKPLQSDRGNGIEIHSSDRGPGIEDI